MHERGITVCMVTGDAPGTARTVASALGITDVDAGILPEDKFHLVERLQHEEHIVGMTGDGVNDAPPLRQADVGIAVANATDIAKAAAGLVLTTSGLAGLPVAVDVGRAVYQRMLTWTLNKLVKAQQAAAATRVVLDMAQMSLIVIDRYRFNGRAVVSDRPNSCGGYLGACSRIEVPRCCSTLHR